VNGEEGKPYEPKRIASSGVQMQATEGKEARVESRTASSSERAEKRGNTSLLRGLLQVPSSEPIEDNRSEVQNRRLGASLDSLRIRVVGLDIGPAVRSRLVQMVVSHALLPRAAAESRDVVAILVDLRGLRAGAAVALAPPADPRADLGQVAAVAFATLVGDRVVGVAVGFEHGAFLVAGCLAGVGVQGSGSHGESGELVARV
jgi:hypothetical protein